MDRVGSGDADGLSRGIGGVVGLGGWRVEWRAGTGGVEMGTDREWGQSGDGQCGQGVGQAVGKRVESGPPLK